MLARAVTAARAARAVISGAAGSSDAATAAALRVLDQRMTELEEMADRLEAARGEEDPLFLAFDRIVSAMATLRRRVDVDGAMGVIDAAQADWEHARG